MHCIVCHCARLLGVHCALCVLHCVSFAWCALLLGCLVHIVLCVHLSSAANKSKLLHGVHLCIIVLGVHCVHCANNERANHAPYKLPSLHLVHLVTRNTPQIVNQIHVGI